MRLVYTTIFDAKDINAWSGTPYFMCEGLKENGIDLDYIGPLDSFTSPAFQLRQFIKRIVGAPKTSWRYHPEAIKHYAKQVENQLKKIKADAIISPTLNPVTKVNTKLPIILWTDALPSALMNFYTSSSSVSKQSLKQMNELTREGLQRCQLIIFSSDWAAQHALSNYGISENKIKVVPFGANLHPLPIETIDQTINNRCKDKIKLLFIGVNWWRKGGDIVIETAKAIHSAGYNVEVDIIGCQPPKNLVIPSYINCHGFISKHTEEGKEKIINFFKESHFLFVPSRAEAFGIVFCEAGAYALPCLTSYVGGIRTIVKDHLNGMTFALDSSPTIYRDHIINTMNNKSHYQQLAKSSYAEYEKRLNWKIATEQVKQLIENII